jgi:uncharacterized protein with von Willebrand factor type A (vWA) domain
MQAENCVRSGAQVDMFRLGKTLELFYDVEHAPACIEVKP